ncbi:hypothetical protein ACHAXR_000811, partial [Thalassiosira sp. AJA248-18]
MSIRHPALDVGTPSNEFQEWEIIPVRFHGFEGLDASKGTCVYSPEFTCFGNQWRLEIYPGGLPNSDDGMVGVGLRNMFRESIELLCGFNVKRKNGNDVAHCDRRALKKRFTPNDPENNGWGRHNFAKRSEIVGALVAGALVIEVRMWRTDSIPFTLQPFVPENPCSKMILKMFTDEESADVVLEVKDGDQKVGNTRKRTPSSIVKFHAHRVILKQCAPMLAELCGP